LKIYSEEEEVNNKTLENKKINQKNKNKRIRKRNVDTYKFVTIVKMFITYVFMSLYVFIS